MRIDNPAIGHDDDVGWTWIGLAGDQIPESRILHGEHAGRKNDREPESDLKILLDRIHL
jgi:hypothetical protein